MLLPLSIVGLKDSSFTPTKISRPIFKAPPRPYKSVSADFNHISVQSPSKSPVFLFIILLYGVCKWVKKRCDLNKIILQTSTHAMLFTLIKPSDHYRLTIAVARLLLDQTRQKHSRPDRWLMSRRDAALNELARMNLSATPGRGILAQTDGLCPGATRLSTSWRE